jgi:hypothetical protein
MTWEKRLEKKLEACLAQAKSAQEIAQRGIDYIRSLLEKTEDAERKDAYRRQLRHLRGIVRSCKSEIAAIKELLSVLRGEKPKVAKGNEPPPPPLPTTIRVFVPKGVKMSDDEIVKLVLQKLNLNGYAKATQA